METLVRQVVEIVQKSVPMIIGSGILGVGIYTNVAGVVALGGIVIIGGFLFYAGVEF